MILYSKIKRVGVLVSGGRAMLAEALQKASGHPIYVRKGFIWETRWFPWAAGRF